MQEPKQAILLRYFIDLFEKVSADQPDFLTSMIVDNSLNDFLYIPSSLAKTVINQSVEIYQDMPELVVSDGLISHKKYANNFFIWLMASSNVFELVHRFNIIIPKDPFRVIYSDNTKVIVTLPKIIINSASFSVFSISLMIGLFSTVLPEANFLASTVSFKNNRNQFLESIRNTQVDYGSEMNQITIIQSDILQMSLSTSNFVLGKMLSDSSNIEDIILKPDIVFSVQKIIRKSIHETGLSLQDIASELCLTPRTLQRRLKEKNQNFQSLLNNERRCKAIELMNKKQLPRSIILEKIGVQNLRTLYRIINRH